ncbi:MAG: hypothetical protein R3E10_03645 [Gemmatimonadota bacterium]
MRHALASLAVLLSTAQFLTAQEQPSQEPPTLVGHIVDVRTGTPLLGAWIGPEQADWGTYTRADGGFRLPRVHAGPDLYRVEMLGYADLLIELAPDGPVQIEMEPDPIVLEGVKVVADRFKRRRNATAVSVRTIERQDLLWSGAADLLDFIRGRAGVHLIPCPRGSFISYASLDCAYVRGRPAEIKVCLDEAPLLGGADQLRMISPQELHMVEVYQRGAHIRLYTEQFMQKAARRRLGVPPLGFGFC